MSNHVVIMECGICGDSPLVKTHFGPYHWGEKRCAHDLCDSIVTLVTNDQWKHVCSKSGEFILVGAKMDEKGFLTSVHGGGVVPFHSPSLQIREVKELRAIEFFAGGYSGWTHACRSLTRVGLPITVKFAIDIDIVCAENYCQTHGIEKLLHGPSPELGHEEVFEKIFVCDDICNHAWMHVTGSERYDIAMISPPCPPWSKAANEQGLQSNDGMLTLHIWSKLSILRVPVVCMEMVAAMLEHEHWHVVKMYIRWCGYRIMWVKDMHLQEILPQTRNRMLLIAILDDEPLHPHRCTEWSRVEAYTLQSYKALFLLNETWMKHAMPDSSTLDMYLDPALLPGMRGHFGVANKKCKRDVEAYRIRLPHGIASCIMANYSFSHLLPKHVIERKGLFGSLILSAQGIRFFALPELIALFGTTNSLILPKNIRKAIHIVGNCIAVPHAVLAVANAAAFYMPSLSQVDVQELVHKVHALRLHHDNMIALEGELSFSFQKRVEIGISPTQPLHSFHYIRITSPLEEFVLECEVGVGIIEAVKILTGPSFPAHLFIVFDHQPAARINVPDDMTMAEHDLHLQANVPSVLMINEEYITNEVVSSTCIVVLFPEKAVVYMRQKDMTCGDVVELINCTHESDEPHFILNLMGLKLSDGSICPTCVFAVSHPIQWQDMSILNMIKIETCKQMMRFSGSGQALKDTLELFHKTGTTQMLHALGWHFVSVFDMEGNLQMDSITLIRRTATFNAMIPDITMFIMSRLFILGLNQANLFPTSEDPGIQVYLKLWGSWIWQGLIPPQASLVPIELIWIGLALCFKCEMDIRFILHGRQINPEYPLSAYASSDQVVKIFATMSLKGGAGRTEQYIDLTSHDHDSLSGPSDASDARAQLARLEAFDYDRAIAAIVTHWVGNRGLFFGHQLDEILLLRYSEENGMICYDGPMRSVMSFLQLMQDLKMVDEIENLGWIIAVQFVESYSPVVTRLVIFPRPALEVVSTKIIQSFLHVGFFFAALPTPSPSTSSSVITRIKVWGVVVYHERLPFDCKVHHIVDAWDLACDMVSVPIPITVICRGRRLNPDFPLGEYVRQNEDGNYVANLHLAVSLRGGGNQKDFAIMQKNALATFLLSEGGDLSEIATFTDSVIKGAGPQAVAAVLSLKSKSAKWDGVKKLGDTLQLTWPNFIKKKLDRKVAVDNKFRKDAASLWEDLHLPDIKIKDSFFLNEDDSACPQITTMMPSTTGVCLLKASEAEEWLKKTGTFSQDELAIIVIGPCPCTEPSKCHRLQFPAFDATSQPIVMTGCMHNVGRKHVKVGLTNDAKIKIDDTVVVSWTIYRDEVGETWESIQQAPVKTTIELALGNQPEVSFIGPPWGRSFQKDKKKCSPNEATSLQFHSRINQDALTKILRISGMHGIYTTQKTEHKQISNAYQIVWVQLSSVDLIVTASTFPNHCGIVRNSKYDGKLSKGIRFLKGDFEEAFKQLKPGIDVPSLITPNYTYKITPVPLGATFDHIQKWLDLQKWKAKPVRSLSNQVWIVAADAPIEAQFAQWNGETLLVKPILPKRDRQPVIVAGAIPKPKVHDANLGKMPLKEDPWERYRALNPTSHGSTPAPSIISQPVQRKIEGPIETKFEQQQLEIQTLKDSAKEMQVLKQDITEIQKALQVQSKNHDALRQDVTVERQKIRHETKEQMKTLSDTFQESLAQSLAQQDRQLMRQFDDLKELLQRPGAAKKAKATPPDHQEEQMDQAL